MEDRPSGAALGGQLIVPFGPGFAGLQMPGHGRLGEASSTEAAFSFRTLSGHWHLIRSYRSKDIRPLQEPIIQHYET
jgi:hypothetical protein